MAFKTKKQNEFFTQLVDNAEETTFTNQQFDKIFIDEAVWGLYIDREAKVWKKCHLQIIPALHIWSDRPISDLQCLFKEKVHKQPGEHDSITSVGSNGKKLRHFTVKLVNWEKVIEFYKIFKFSHNLHSFFYLPLEYTPEVKKIFLIFFENFLKKIFLDFLLP